MNAPWYTRTMPFFFLTFFFAPVALFLLLIKWTRFDGHDRTVKVFFATGMTLFLLLGLIPRIF